MLLPCRCARRRQGMHDNVLSRVMLLRQTLLQSSDAEAVQDMLQQANALMQMELKHDVCIDLGCTSRDNTLLAKVAELEHMGRAIGDDELKARVAVHLRNVMSACVCSSLCGAAAKPNNSDTISTHDKLQHVRSNLLGSFQT